MEQPLDLDLFLRWVSFVFRIAFLGPYRFEVLSREVKNEEAVGKVLYVEHPTHLRPPSIEDACRTQLTCIQMVCGHYPLADSLRVLYTKEKRCRSTGRVFCETAFQPAKTVLGRPL